MKLLILYIIVTSCTWLTFGALNRNSFPKDFLFGVSTSAYQIEGAWNENGKGQNIWDQFTHEHPEKILDHSTGDIACDSYHKIKEDISLLKELGVQFYRFSISWSRLLPCGYSYFINSDGLRYYNELINELIENGIKPVVTLYHWDLPFDLQNLGGWTNSLLVDIFYDYAKIAFEKFGDRVPYWITLNGGCGGYGNDFFAPCINQSGIADYLCKHFQLKAHAKVYQLYNEEFKDIQKGQIGIVVNDEQWYEAKTNKKEDVDATERAREFSMGWYATPLLKSGDYPKIMKDRIDYRSKMEGYKKSRLPKFSKEEVDSIKGAYDFIAIHLYTSSLVSNMPTESFETISYTQDIEVSLSHDPQWPSSSAEWLKVVPSTPRSLLKWMKTKYNNPPIMIVENGFADNGEIDDYGRISYYQLYLSSILDAIHEDHANVIGYTAWSLLDNFEWNAGYTQRFGLYHVAFNDSKRPRKPKLSATFYKNLIKHRSLEKNERGEL